MCVGMLTPAVGGERGREKVRERERERGRGRERESKSGFEGV